VRLFFNVRIIPLLLLLIPSLLKAQNKYWQQQVNFVIDVTLNDVEHTLDAFEKIEYTNNAPDTLHFIWFHIWPNAYKNDKTAFSEQLLKNDRTDFYFSRKEQRGYLNRLDFKVNGNTAKIEDHPQYIDIVKLLLPEPLAPNQKIIITTPFHVKLSENFSRGGHVKQSYQVTQWYPSPAVYDREGWHPMPYLDQGEFYNEFGNYDVRITVPGNYVVAASGDLQNKEEIVWLKEKSKSKAMAVSGRLNNTISRSKATKQLPQISLNDFPGSDTTTKSLRYLQNNIHTFAWFADKRFIVDHDTVHLSSGKIINAWSYYLPADIQMWKHCVQYMKDAIHTRSEWLGDYPYNNASTVEAQIGFYGGMEYPAITSISPMDTERELDETLAHELSHNWFYAALATNERRYPWMDEGMNTYYDERYSALKYGTIQKPANAIQSKLLPEESEGFIFEILAGIKKDQPINTPAENFSELNYELVAYIKTSEWMQLIENKLGKNMFDSCMHEYYRQWQFKHPYPQDFKRVLETVSLKNMDEVFSLLDKKGSLLTPVNKKLGLTVFFNLKDTHSKNYIAVAPLPGFNLYDGFMIGAMIHNYQLPLNPFSFYVLPMFATNSKKIRGMVRVSYTWYPDGIVSKWDAGASLSRFSMNEFKPEGKNKLYPGFTKLAPFVRVTFKEHSASEKTLRYIQFKSFLISEEQLNFTQFVNGADTSNFADLKSHYENINQLKFVLQNPRVLYPYSGELILEQNKDFYRASFTGSYYFNYANRLGGLEARIFAGKFFYNGASTNSKQLQTDRYHLNLSAPNGYEDYTYRDYFAGRNKFENWGSQQIMIRDGAFKVRTELLNNKTGKTDGWLIAGNLVTDIPVKFNPLEVLPFKVPLKIFADIGTYADAWQHDADTNKFLFDAGLELSLFKETLNIYIPILYSKVFRDYFRSSLGNNKFLKTISFSIDIRHFTLRKINRYIPL